MAIAVLPVPRLLRPLFARRRALLGKLCHIVERLCARFYASARPGARPGIVLFVQTFGDLVNFNTHIHVLAADGAFDADGGFTVLPPRPRHRLIPLREGWVRWAEKNNSLLIVTWDEDDGSEQNRIPTLRIGPMVRPGQYTQRIDHCTLLRTLLDMYALPAIGNSADVQAIDFVWR